MHGSSAPMHKVSLSTWFWLRRCIARRLHRAGRGDLFPFCSTCCMTSPWWKGRHLEGGGATGHLAVSIISTMVSDDSQARSCRALVGGFLMIIPVTPHVETSRAVRIFSADSNVQYGKLVEVN